MHDASAGEGLLAAGGVVEAVGAEARDDKGERQEQVFLFLRDEEEEETAIASIHSLRAESQDPEIVGESRTRGGGGGGGDGSLDETFLQS